MGLHQLFAVYSYGLLLIAVFITIYFMFVVVAETAQSGTAFGKRFNKVWAPIRIVVAFGLLVPIAFGMNSGQFIVLYAVGNLIAYVQQKCVYQLSRSTECYLKTLTP